MGGLGFTALDYGALAFFACAWLGYHVAVEVSGARGHSLNERMNGFRHVWMEQLVRRENRIVDTTIMASLQNGTAFFASTSLIAIGGVLALFQATDTVMGLFREIPLVPATDRATWELKLLGLAVIFVYAFFKFGWAYRLFNYTAILVGAVPPGDHPASRTAARRAAAMSVVAGRHFNRGQRAFFFALAYLGWFVAAPVFIVATAAVLYVMWHRQFASDALEALTGEER